MRTIKIAIDLPRSERSGALFALKQVEDKHFPEFDQVEIVPVLLSTTATSSPAAAKNEFQRKVLDDSAVVAEIGPYDAAVARKEMVLASNAQLPLVTPDITDECLTSIHTYCRSGEPQSLHPKGRSSTNPSGNTFLFRVCATAASEGAPAADYAFDVLGKRTAVVVDDQSSYGLSLSGEFARRFQVKGGQVLASRTFNPATGDMASLARDIQSRKPDLLYLGTHDPALAGHIKAAASDFVGAAFGGDALQSDVYIAAAGAHADGTYATELYVDARASAPAFMKAFQQVYPSPEDYGPSTLYAHDAMEATLTALRQAILPFTQNEQGLLPTRDVVRGAVAGTRFPSEYLDQGLLSFDQNGDNQTKLISIYASHGGQWEFKSLLNFAG